MRAASGFAHAFCPQSGQVNFVLLAFFAFPSAVTGIGCQGSLNPVAASFLLLEGAMLGGRDRLGGGGLGGLLFIDGTCIGIVRFTLIRCQD